MMRCCRPSLEKELRQLHPPFAVGLEVPCEYCADFWIWNGERWQHSDEFEHPERMARRASPKLIEARAKRGNDILKKE